MKRILVPRNFGIAVMGLVAVAAVLTTACGGTETKVEAHQAAADTSATAATQTPAPAIATVAATPVPVAATQPPVVQTPAPTEAPKATPVSATPAPPAPVDVNITLSNFKIESSLTAFQLGVPYHFIITNNGTITHETNIANVNATGEVAVGATKTLDVTFTTSGQQEFACHITGHYEAGMKLPMSIGP